MRPTMRLRIWALAAGALLGAAAPAAAQDRRDEQFYYPGGFNWAFLRNYPEAARLFNAFDYGHAVLYERLLTTPSSETPTLIPSSAPGTPVRVKPMRSSVTRLDVMLMPFAPEIPTRLCTM